MIAPDLYRAAAVAAAIAAGCGRAEVEVGHLLIAVLDDLTGRAMLEATGASAAEARAALIAAFGTPCGPTMPGVPHGWSSDLVRFVASIAPGVDGHLGVDGFLAAVGRAPDHPAAAVLAGAGVDLASLARIAGRMRRRSVIAARDIPAEASAYCRDLVLAASENRLDPAIGRDAEIARVADVLRRRKKANPVLVGEPGVGKTAIVEGLACAVADGDVGDDLLGLRILSLDVARMVAGARNRGDFEERLKALLDALEADRDLVLFVDEIHTLAGGASGTADAANLLKPALASGAIRVIGATTHAEYARYFDADAAWSRRFQPVEVREPGVADTVELLKRVARSYETHHGVRYEPEALVAAAELTSRHLPSRRLPDKAIDAIDEAASLARSAGERNVTTAHVLGAVSRASGMRIEETRVGALHVGAELLAAVIGQDEAVSAVAAAVRRARSGLCEPGSVAGCVLLRGPEGTGKSFLADTLAAALDLPNHVVDMSEFRAEHSVARLIGSPPGYIGHGSGGQLTEAVRRTPACVVTLDHVDLAHPDVRSVILRGIERGVLVDTSGRRVDLSGATFVMTVTEAEGRRARIGFGGGSADDAGEGAAPADVVAAADVVATFGALASETLREVAERRLAAFADRVAASGAGVRFDGSVAVGIAERVSASGNGAKSLKRIVREVVEDPVADVLSARTTAVLDAAWADGRLSLDERASDPAPARAGHAAVAA